MIHIVVMELMGIQEIAELAGVSAQAVANWVKRKVDFPAPLAQLASGSVWNGTDIRLWLSEQTGPASARGPGGRGFVRGRTYTLAQICGELGGETQSYLPQRQGQIVCARLTAEMNPGVPHEVLVGDLPRVRQKAALLAEQKGPIPVFIKEGPNRWRYHGRMVCTGFGCDRKLVRDCEARSGRADLAGVLRLIDVQ